MLGINEVEMDKFEFIMSLIFELYSILVFELQWIIYKVRRNLLGEVFKMKARAHTGMVKVWGTWKDLANCFIWLERKKMSSLK